MREIYFLNSLLLNQNLDNEKVNSIKKKIIFVHLLKTTQIKHIEVVEPFSKIYINIFDSQKFYFHFIIFINMILLLSSIFLTNKITKFIFPKFDNKLRMLIILNIFFLPINLIYYTNFFKEPFLLFSIAYLFKFYNFLPKKLKY